MLGKGYLILILRRYICPKGMSFIESFLAMVLGKLVLYVMRSAQRRTNGDTF